MKQVKTLGLIITAAVILASCGGSKKDDNAVLNDLKSQIEKAKQEKLDKEVSIKKMEDQLLKMDTNAANASKIKLVSVAPVTAQKFVHYIDLQARVGSDNISYISSRGMGGQVKALYIKEGDVVKKGQLILKTDDAIMRQSLEASKKGLEGIKTQLGFAKNIYARQKNLWDQGIGTEVQLISAKTNVESLQNQLTATEEGVKVAVEQLNTASVYSDVNGIANTVSVKVGEMFSPGQIVIVNTASLKAMADIPENYITRVQRGIPVQVLLPDVNQKYNSTISLVSQTINPNSRGFSVEAKIPSAIGAKPNQAAIMKIMDYSSPNAVVIPVNMVQTDESGKYVYIMIKSSTGKTTAHRVTVILGEVYGDKVEIKNGLTGGEQLITEGYQSLYEGQVVSTKVTLN